MQAPSYLVEVRNRDLERKGQIAPEYTDLKFTEVHRGVGAWELKLPNAHPLLGELKQEGAGIIVTKRWLVTPPSTYGAWTESRRNLHSNPKLATASNSWFASTATSRQALSIPEYPEIQFGWLASSTTAAINRTLAATFSGLTVGQTYTASVLTNTVGPSWEFGVWDGIVSTAVTPTNTVRPYVPNASWHWETITFVAAATSASVGFHALAAMTGITYGLTGATVEHSSGFSGFFTGDTNPDDPELQRYSWTGTVNGSASIEETRVRTDYPEEVRTKVYSGRMKSAVLSQNATDPDGTWTISGYDDGIVAAATQVLPDPAHAPDAQEAGYWQQAGDGESVMKAAVRLNAGDLAISERSYPWLTSAPNLGRGASVQVSARFDVLGDVLTSLGAAAGLGWRFSQAGDVIEFDVFEVQDKSALVRLDVRNGGLESTELGLSAPGASVVYVLGQGEGQARTVLPVSTTDSEAAAVLWALRWEQSKDQRNTDDPVELQQAGEEILAAQGQTVKSLKVTPSDAPGQAVGVDWDLGDTITVSINGVPAQATVSQLATAVGPTGVIVQATVGDPVGYDWDARVTAKVKDHEKRISDVENRIGTVDLGPLETEAANATAAIANAQEWAALTGPLAFSAAYKGTWSRAIDSGGSLVASTGTSGITIGETGIYHVTARQRGTGSGSGYTALALNGSRSTLETRATGVYFHDHTGAANQYATSEYYGELIAGELITAGAPDTTTAAFLSYTGNSFTGGIVVQRIS